MYQAIKNLAELALKLQNKNKMDEAFKQIIAICDDAQCMKCDAQNPVNTEAEAKMIADVQRQLEGTDAQIYIASEEVKFGMPAKVVIAEPAQDLTLEQCISDVAAMIKPQDECIEVKPTTTATQKSSNAKKGGAK